MKIWIDGAVRPPREARVSVLDHGLLYGDGLFEGMRIRSGAVFRLDRHLARLAHGASALDLSLPLPLPSLRDVVLETARAFGRPEAYVRLLVTRGEGALGVDPSTCREGRVICIVDEVRLYPEEKQRAGLDLLTSSWRRPGPDVLDPRVKSLNYLNSVLAKHEARRRGADEALVLNAAGRVAEASVANVFAVREGVLRTPPVQEGALEGITRGAVLDVAEELGFPTRVEPLTRMDFIAADEAFLTGSGAGIVPVRSLDAAPVGRGAPGPHTLALTQGLLDRAPGWGVAF